MAASYSTTIADEPGINNPTTNYIGVKNIAVEDNLTSIGQISYLPVARNTTINDAGLVTAMITPEPQSLVVSDVSESRQYNNPPAVDTSTTTDTTRVIVGEGNTVVQTSDNVVIYINNNEKDTVYITEVTEQYNQQFINNGTGNSIPGGINGQIQFNNVGILAGAADLIYNSDLGVFYAGNLSVTKQANLGSVGNITITGGSSNQVLTTDGLGNLYWANGSGGNGIPGGSNTQVQFNDSGAFGATANFTFDYITSTVTASYFSGDGSNLTNVPGGGPVTITNVSTLGTYSVNINDQVLVIRTPGPVTISLPSVIETGRRIVIKDFLGNSRVGNAITIVSPPTNTIDGSVAFAIDEPYNVVTVVGASSTEWMIL